MHSDALENAMKSRSRLEWARELARRADEALLVRRLRQLGVRRSIEVHENRTVLVSLTSRGVMRVHRGYTYGSDRMLRAVIAFVSPSSRRDARAEARRVIVNFPVDSFVHTRTKISRRRKLDPADRPLLRELNSIHNRLNSMYFSGELSAIAFRISGRMRTKLGELSLDSDTNRPTEIAISRFHLSRDGWQEVEHTVLHEMIHQWQAEKGLSVDHGATFRRLARSVGVEPHANR